MTRNRLSASELIAGIRRQGGDIRIGPKGNIQFKNCPEELKAKVRANSYCVLAWLKEERPTRAWEASGRNPDWWRTYQTGNPVYLTQACTCSAYSFPHIHSDPGPEPNWNPDGDVFEEIKSLMKQSKKETVH